MKTFAKKFVGPLLLAIAVMMTVSGCYEYRYNRRYNHHSRGWYDRRHVVYPAGVNFEVDVRR